jgi:prepilin-type N-terminal cleavage/methylation domain-containing protein
VGSNASRRAGFSLIELLVVVSVVCVLGALLLPALARARERSRATVCLGNLRQLGQAMQLYFDDHQLLPVANAAGYLMWNGTNYLLYARMLRRADDALAGSFFCPSSRMFPRGDAQTGIGNLGVAGKLTASSYFARGTDQGAPLGIDGRRQALLADLYYSAAAARNHAAGIHVLYSDGSVWFQPLAGHWDQTDPACWAQLDATVLSATP